MVARSHIQLRIAYKIPWILFVHATGSPGSYPGIPALCTCAVYLPSFLSPDSQYHVSTSSITRLTAPMRYFFLRIQLALLRISYYTLNMLSPASCFKKGGQARNCAYDFTSSKPASLHSFLSRR